MGCNCKAIEHVSRIKRYYGYEKEVKKNISLRNKVKMILKAFLIWAILLFLAPLTLIVFIFNKFILRRESVFLKKIKIRL